MGIYTTITRPASLDLTLEAVSLEEDLWNEIPL